MTTIILILLSLVAFIFNVDAPDDLSSTSFWILLFEYISILYLSKMIINKLLKDDEVKIRQRYYNLFLVGFIVSLFLLAFSWTPFLSVSNPNWGFDPQRYYYYASRIIQNDDYSFGLNYTGVVYFYTFVMRIFGIDPLIPLFANSLFTLTAVLLIAKLIVTNKKIYIGYFAWLLLIPEIIYFNIMSSREILCMSIAVFIISAFVNYLKTKQKKYLLILLLELLFLLLIRPPFAFSIFISILIFLIFFSQHKVSLLNMTVLVAIVIAIGTQFSSNMGSVNTTDMIQKSVVEKIDGKQEKNSSFNYNENSLAAQLIPDNAIEFVVFGVIRSLLYLFPAPSVFSSLLSISNAYDIGDTFINLTSIIMMLFIPGIYLLLKNVKGQEHAVQLIGISFFVFWIIVGAFNTTLIHVRYRVVYDLLYFSLMIYFVGTTDNQKIKQLFTYWCGILLLIVFLFFVVRKII